MSKHSARRNIRGGVAAGAVLSAAILTSGFAYASASPAVVPTTCADALTAYNNAQNQENIDKGKLNAANAELDAATKALADARAADVAEDTNTDGTVKTDQSTLDAADQAKSAAESRAFRAGEAQSSAQSTYNADVTATKAAKAAADTACQGPTGPAGAQGPAGVAGKDGIDAKIILAPTVCARATVTPNPAKLVRVIALIPCPPVVPPAPPVEPSPGTPVTVISNPAPVPPVQETHLPVTH